MIQNLLDGHGVFNAGYDAHWTLALLAGLDVDIEYPFQPLGPGHRHMTLGEAAIIAILSSLPATLAPARWCDQSPVVIAVAPNNDLLDKGDRPRFMSLWKRAN